VGRRKGTSGLPRSRLPACGAGVCVLPRARHCRTGGLLPGVL
jgi:hypothetical protein